MVLISGRFLKVLSPVAGEVVRDPQASRARFPALGFPRMTSRIPDLPCFQTQLALVGLGLRGFRAAQSISPKFSGPDLYARLEHPMRS